MSKNTLPSIKGAGADTSRSLAKQQSSVITAGEQSIYDIDKKKYGALLPKTGVYFLPDQRIISFLT